MFSKEENYQDGEIIFEEGSVGNHLYMVESGKVLLYKVIEHREVGVGILHPGDLLGEHSFLAKIPRIASARAMEKTTLKTIDCSLLAQEYEQLSIGFKEVLKSSALHLTRSGDKIVQPKFRRKEPRVSKTLALIFKTEDSFINAFSADLSASGLFIKTSRPLTEGVHFNLKLQLPNNSDVLSIGCRVAWSRTDADSTPEKPPGMGVQFVDIRPADRQRLTTEISNTDQEKI